MSEAVFRVSDSMVVPLRGHMLRLKLLEGSPSIKAFKSGGRLRLAGPDGAGGTVDIIGTAAVGGRATQKLLEARREVDVVIPMDQAVVNGSRVQIGWTAHPAERDES